MILSEAKRSDRNVGASEVLLQIVFAVAAVKRAPTSNALQFESDLMERFSF
jgi:hypothetical protein